MDRGRLLFVRLFEPLPWYSMFYPRKKEGETSSSRKISCQIHRPPPGQGGCARVATFVSQSAPSSVTHSHQSPHHATYPARARPSDSAGPPPSPTVVPPIGQWQQPQAAHQGAAISARVFRTVVLIREKRNETPNSSQSPGSLAPPRGRRST